MTKLKLLWPLILKRSRALNHAQRIMSLTTYDKDDDDSDGSSEKSDEEREKPLTLKDLQEPTNCCMSGCANCVWIDYAEKLSSVLKHSPGDIEKLIKEKVQDPNMRAFLMSELKQQNVDTRG